MSDRPTEHAEWAIRTDGLTKRYGQRLVVDDLALRVPAGQITGFLGPNGAGKTTTLAMLLGLVRSTAGRIEVLGRDVARDRPAVQRQMGALLETAALYPFLSVAENLEVQARLTRADRRRLPSLLERIGLTEQAQQKARTLSLGQRQRLGLGLALLGEPALLLLDEPTNGLDPAGLRAVHDLLRHIVAAGGTIFFSSHRLSEVQDLCSQVVIIDHGRLVAQGTVESLLGGAADGWLQLRVSEPARARALLQAAGWVAQLVDDTPDHSLRVQAPAGRAAEVNALLTAANIGVTELRVEQPGLEEIFLRLTGAGHG